MNRLPTRICLTFLATVLAACATTSPSVNYYSLEPGTVTTTQDKAGAKVMAFGPLRVPEYLNRSQLVTRGTGSNLTVHEYDRWAEPVEDAIHRVVAAQLDSQLDGVTVVAYRALQALAVDFRLLGQVDRFEADASGKVVLQLQWSVLDKDEHALIPPRRDRYEAQAANPGEAGAIVGAMNQALDRFSRDAAGRLREALASAEAIKTTGSE